MPGQHRKSYAGSMKGGSYKLRRKKKSRPGTLGKKQKGKR